MKRLPVIASFGIVVLLLCSGCETYLGYHYDNLKPEIEQVEKSSSEKQRYWQYHLHGRKLKLLHSVVEEVRIDETMRYTHRRVETYFKPEGSKSLVKGLGRESFATIVIAFPFALVGDVLVGACKTVASCWKCERDWLLDEHWPNFMYILGYMPVICVLNPFMDAPYMSSGSLKLVDGEVEVYQVDHNNVFREREKPVKPERDCTLKLNDLKRKLEIGASGKAEIDLRECLGNKPLIPEFPLDLSLHYGRNTVIELKLKSTQLLDGDELYLLRLAQDEKANLSARLKAVKLLRSQGVLSPERAEAMVRSLLSCERFADSIKN